jgi:glycosyltransferase involved in cell wall biosynthesis
MATSPLRVLYCTDTYPPQVNGVSVVTALSVAGLRARGWEVEVIAPSYPGSQPNPFEAAQAPGPAEQVTPVPSVRLPLYPEIRVAAPVVRIADRVMRRFRPGLVHLATEFMIGRIGQRAALRAGIPMVSSYHTDFSRYTGSYGIPWLGAPVRRYIARFHARSRRVYTPGRPAAADLGQMGISGVEIWGRGVDLVTFQPGRRDLALRRAYASDDMLLFIHVGRLAAEKNVECVLEGFRLARLKVGGRLPMHLVIAGSGPRERALRAMADQHVTFLGTLDRKVVLPRLYASADAFLFASESETLGLVILEAMASGLPVIAAPAGGVADHLRDGQNGLAFPAGDSDALAARIVALAESPELLRRLAAGALRTASAMSWEHELDRLDASYREVLEAHHADHAA